MVVKLQKLPPGDVLEKKTFLKILQNNRKKPASESLFDKIAGCRHVALTKSDSKTGAFLQIAKILEASIEYLRVTASEPCLKQWWKYRTTALKENAFTICPKNNAHFYKIGIFKTRI